jgi:predicted peroxiredoxin
MILLMTGKTVIDKNYPLEKVNIINFPPLEDKIEDKIEV